VSDQVELAAAVLLVLLYVASPWLERIGQKIAMRTGFCMALLALAAVGLRLALLPAFPVPTPSGSDDFSHLLVADTLAHFRLANAVHPFHRFFEANFVLQEPSYSSMYPPGLGLFLALGRMLFGHPWAGMVMVDAGFCGLCYWTLRAWVTPGWALAGGLLAVIEFGPLNQWMNTYWANAIPAAAGCLVFGALGRIAANGEKTRYGVLVGVGLALHLITRPFETLLLGAAVLLFTHSPRVLIAAAGPVTAAALLLLCQNKAVTGSWTTLPYMTARYEYGVPATFVFEPNPTPHRPLTQEQDLNYRAQCAIHGDRPETVRSFFERLGYRVRYYRFFLLPPLYVALLVFLLTVRDRKWLPVIGAVILFAIGSNFYPYLYAHYIGAVSSLLVLMTVVGLGKLGRWRIGKLLFLLCAMEFGISYGQRWMHGPEDSEGRIAINRQLDSAQGKQLVFVRYAPNHGFHEWIHNAADIDGSRVVWALDFGDEENRKLMAYYPDRRVWLVEPDAQPPRITGYSR